MFLIPKIWEGGRCFIIGGGPSMPRQFGVPEEIIQKVLSGELSPGAYSPYLKAIHNEHIIAVNIAMLLGDWVDILFFGDDSFWTRFKKEILEFRGLRMTCMHHPEAIYHKRVKVLKRIRTGSAIYPHRDGVMWHNNSGATAINVAYHLGVKQIILLGFDMQLDNKQNQHWHKYYAGNPKTVGATFKMHMRGFPAIAG
jgi:hypothetical protein